MANQKYYVAMKCDRAHRMSKEIDGIGYFFHHTNSEIKSHSFTKSELAEIMNGALYKVKQKPRNITIDQLISDGWDRLIGNTWEWINPLIELIPVEEET